MNPSSQIISFDRNYNSNSIVSVQSKNGLNYSNENLKRFKIKSYELENIISYTSNITFTEKTLVKKTESNLPYSIVHNPATGNSIILCKTRRLRPIGFGSSCNLTVGLDLNSNTKVAFRSMPAKSVTAAEREINTRLSERPDLFVAAKEIYDYSGTFNLKEENHPKTEKSTEIVPKTGFVLECLDCDLFDLLRQGKLSIRDKIDISIDIAEALEVMHNTFGIVHRDLKLNNIFVTVNEDALKKYTAKIGDFGQSARRGTIPLSGAGTKYFLPPEWKIHATINLQNNEEEKPKAQLSSDMWSFGVVLLYLFGGGSTRKYWNKLWDKHGDLSSSFPQLKQKLLSIFEQDFIQQNDTDSTEKLERLVELESLVEVINYCLEVDTTFMRMNIKMAAKMLRDLKNTHETESVGEVSVHEECTDNNNQSGYCIIS